jgi:serine/threonine protein kinase
VDERSARWNRITPSGYAWEREALDYLRQHLPDQEPYRAWANFEFITHGGAIYEVDAAVLTPRGFFVVEIKSRPGEITGDAGTWHWRNRGKVRVDDNPLLLTNRKAKTLKSLLQGTKSGRRLKQNWPFVEALVFLSAPGLKVDLDDVARTGLFGRGGQGSEQHLKPGQLPGVVGHLLSTVPKQGPGLRRPITAETAKLLTQAMEQSGIRPSKRSLRAGDYELQGLLSDGPGFQEFEATHVQVESVRKRVRIYVQELGASDETRATYARAAEHEYRVLQELRHPGVLAVETLTSHDLGQALVFEHDPAAQRLDHWLAEHGERLSVDTRLDIVRQIADAVRYAHSRRIAHRALSPRSVLVFGGPDAPQVKVFSWQTAGRAGDGTSSSALPSGTDHLDALVDDTIATYLAPEALTNPLADAVTLDVFSLGAVAYMVLSGRTPAANGIELREALQEGDGLQLSAVLDGVGERLRLLVAQATRPDVVNRYDSVEWFLADLDDVQAEMAAGQQAADVVHPDDAHPGDRLGDFEVARKLGKGSTAVALLVHDVEGRERVLKVALDERADARIDDEHRVLDQLTDRTIVRSHGMTAVGGRDALVLAKAGDKTLARVLREDRTVGPDLLQRWGDDLLAAVAYLEQMGVAHRDVKPENLGVVPLGKDDTLHLVLFDFSLSRAPVGDIRAGTAPYLEPFLVDRPGRRWDTAAERYAAAVTLYQMATGVTPRWGDGQSDPAMLSCEATIETEQMPSSVRDALGAFFARALRRDPRERFDTAVDMRAAWDRAFAQADQPALTSVDATTEPADYAAMAAQLGPDSLLAELGVPQRVVDVLERLDVLTIADLLTTRPGRIRGARNIANKVKRQVDEVRRALRPLFPDLVPPPATRARNGATTDDAGTCSGTVTEAVVDVDVDVQPLDLLVTQLVPPRQRSNSRDPEAVRLLLGLDPLPGAAPDAGPDTAGGSTWPSQGDVAAALDLTRARVSQIVGKARRRWARNRSLTRLREEVVHLVDGVGGVVAGDELAAAVASLRGASEQPDDPVALGWAALRAAQEAESGAAAPRWVIRRSGETVVVATEHDAEGGPTEARGAALADWAVRLGKWADDLAAEDPIPSSAAAVARLRAFEPPEGTPPFADARLMRLAASTSATAALSARLELYPRGLDPRRALRLAQNALLVPSGRPGQAGARLSVDDLDTRVRARYSEMAPLPGRPVLDELLAEVGVPLAWEEADDQAPAGYTMPPLRPAGLSSSLTTGFGTRSVTAGVRRDLGDAVASTNERLEHAAMAGGFLALTAGARLAEDAAGALARFGAARVSVEARLLTRLHEVADDKGVDWARAVEADAAGPGTPDWRRLLQLMGLALPLVADDVRAAGPAVLLTELGPLARYDAMGWLERWRDATLDPASGVRTVWALVAADRAADHPVVDGAVVPVLTDSQWLRLPDPWIRAATSSSPAMTDASEPRR